MREQNAQGVADVMANARYEVSVATVDASSRSAVEALVVKATGLGDVTGLIHAPNHDTAVFSCSCPNGDSCSAA